MARENVGEVRCAFHPRKPAVPVRRDKNGKLFYHCEHGCGPVNPHGRAFQDWMLEHATLYNEEHAA